METKICSKCKESKAITAFDYSSDGKGRRAACKSCTKIRNKILGKDSERQRKTRYGIDDFFVLTILKAQNGKCPICDTDITIKTCVVDHNHDCGRFRGLLCSSCNVAIGYLKDNPESCDRAAAYLRKHK